MLSSYSREQISRALFETDPMNTCCKENNCFDEYYGIAGDIATRVEEGESLKQALITEISEWFFDGQQFELSRLKPVLELFGKEEQ